MLAFKTAYLKKAKAFEKDGVHHGRKYVVGKQKSDTGFHVNMFSVRTFLPILSHSGCEA